MYKFPLILGLLISVLSCKPGHYINTDKEANATELLQAVNESYRLRTDDKITASIWGHNDLSLGSIFSIYSSSESFGKWVLIDSSGNATLPKIGEVKLSGLTTAEAADTIVGRLSKFLVDPVVVIKVINREVTVLGEVKSPGNYLLDKETNSLYEIIGKAEGFLQYANMERIQLIRDNTSYFIDLTELSETALHSIKVQPRDIINIPAKRGKRFDMSSKRIIPFASAITAIAVFFSLIKN
ncbi:MAG: hypothetical protein COA38_09330 [Fluviicola sp.]|nr:MAG: hypothetical protein COA38_09330 [Fluviicola sp.]